MRMRRIDARFPLIIVTMVCSNLPAHCQNAIDSIKPCATDPTYKYFEKVQQNQYLKHPEKRGYLKIDTSSFDSMIEQLRNRPSSISNKPTIDTHGQQLIDKVMAHFKTPTCFESPEIYWLITQYVQQIETARKELHLTLEKAPKFASLPTAEINAYTYPATDTHESVIAFNTQLFMFDYQLAKAVLPSLGIGLDQTHRYVVFRNDPDFTSQYLAAHPEVRANFASSILEFINYAPSHDHAVDQAYDEFIMSLTFGMEGFAVAHEYSHVIHNDRSVVSNLRLEMGDEGRSNNQDSSDGIATVPVLARSWKQELSADELGAQLLIRSVQDDVKRGKDNPIYARARLHGPLFFFTCMEITDRARYIAENGRVPPSLTPEARKFIYDLADGRASQSDPLFSKLGLQNHPPAWLRRARVQKILDPYLKTDSTDEGKMSLVADRVLLNTDLMWSLIEPHEEEMLLAVALGWKRSLKREAIHAVVQSTLLCGDAKDEKGLCLEVLADTFKDAKEYESALVLIDLARYAKDDPKGLENSAGRIYSALGNYDTARRYYKASLDAGRVDGWPEENMALDYSDQGNLDEAEASFRKALSRRATARSQDEFAQYLNDFAWFLITKRNNRQGSVIEASSLSEDAVKLTNSRNGNFVDTLAACRFAAGKTGEAMDLEHKAIDLVRSQDDSSHADEFTSRLQIYEKANRTH